MSTINDFYSTSPHPQIFIEISSCFFFFQCRVHTIIAWGMENHVVSGLPNQIGNQPTSVWLEGLNISISQANSCCFAQTAVVFMKTAVVFLKTAVVFLKTAIVCMKTAVVFMKTAVVFMKTAVVFLKTAIVFRRNICCKQLLFHLNFCWGSLSWTMLHTFVTNFAQGSFHKISWHCTFKKKNKSIVTLILTDSR